MPTCHSLGFIILKGNIMKQAINKIFSGWIFKQRRRSLSESVCVGGGGAWGWTAKRKKKGILVSKHTLTQNWTIFLICFHARNYSAFS